MENSLSLSEKLLLLAVRPGKGGIMFGASQSLDFTLLGAVILEMSLERHVNITDKRVEIISMDHESGAQKYLLEKMSRSSRPRKIGHWMTTLAVSKHKLKSAVYDSLVRKNEVRLEDRHFLFFRWKKPFLHPVNHASNLVYELKDLVIRGNFNPEDIYFLTLLESASLLRRIYPDYQIRKSARLKIRQFKTGMAMSEEIRQAVDTAELVKRSIATSVAAKHAAHVP